MALELKELKEMHDESFVFSQDNRQESAEELIFYYIDQWGDSLNSMVNLGYRGVFDIIKGPVRQVLADLASNPIQIDFKPTDEKDDDDAEILDGLYRSDDNDNRSIWSYENAKEEMVVCGVGAWKIMTEYSSMRNNSTNQDIIRVPIPSANNVLFWDPSSILIDRSDATYCSYLHTYTEKAYKDLYGKLTGEDLPENFAFPETDYTFRWFGPGIKMIYVSEFYYCDTISDKILTMMNPFGIETQVYQSKIKDSIDELMADGFEIVDEKKIERKQVTQYIASGHEILEKNVIVGSHIPIVPCYGEFKIVEDTLHYEGLVRAAKDPQMSHNFANSYLCDVVARSPRDKDIYFPEQITSFEHMYESSGIENNYPYLLQNRTTKDGVALPLGPIARTSNALMSQPLAAMIEMTRRAVHDVATTGLPDDIQDTNLAFKTVLKMEQRFDNQSYIYQHHYKYAKRRDAEIYTSIAAEIYDVPRKVMITLPDGTKKHVSILESVFDPKTGTMKTINDLRNKEFKVYASVGPSFQSQKEQTIETLDAKAQLLPPGDPLRTAFILKSVELMEGVNFDDVRQYARKQLVLSGIKEPETDEEKQLLAQAQQQQQKPDPAMLLAQAEMEKAKADQMETQRKTTEMQLKYAGELADNKIDTFDAQTKRMKVQVDAQKAGADIQMKNIESFGKQLDNATKVIDLEKMRKMSNEEIIMEFAGGQR